MVDEPKGYIQEGFPGPNFPVVYADSVSSIASGDGMVKFYLVRNEPNFLGNNTSHLNTFSQIVMPISGWIAAAVFFEQQLRVFIENGTVQGDAVEALRAQFRIAPDATKP